jgi:hypothetical protein
MQLSLSTRTQCIRHSFFRNKGYGVLAITLFFNLSTVRAQEKCGACSIPSFPALTIYHAFQGGPSMGLGIEAGNWKKDAGKFSYFLGMEILWPEEKETKLKTSGNISNDMMISFYWKGQYKITNRIYMIMQPELINFSSFDLRMGIRYVMPLTKIIGIGIEPGYSLVNKQVSLHTNIHFALR